MGDFDSRVGAPAHAYEDYYKAYSMAMLPGKERLNVSYGGKIIMPTSALARLTQMDIASPYLFELKTHNSDKKTHAGVIEFIAEPGNVHLPAWMMRQLDLNEGDPIRLTGTTLPKGKFVKIQPQTVDFLEISDPKAVLEQAFRNFSCLTKGDIVEISYNCLTFEILIMETVPDAESILIIDTDLEVDFAPPKGYVEPVAKPRPPPPTMASKLKIDNQKIESISASGTSTPSTSGNAERADASGSGTSLGGLGGAFKGQGQSLSGKKSKGKKDKPVEALDPFSMIRRTDLPRVMTNDTQIGDRKVPAALNLPFGQLYFGYEYVPLGAAAAKEEEERQKTGQQRIVFSGAGQTLSGRAPRRRRAEEPSAAAAVAGASGQANAGAADEGTAGAGAAASPEPFGGTGQTLGGGGATTRTGQRSSRKRERGTASGLGKSRKEAIVLDDDDD
ncbi:UFD1-domain-containing protein [Microstroma glucosiphilum]|uniref:UFD1-domain-containing protein n=1 Tax=Pseudomicrostroma glucosiphilum TaxID=1684307 RepID=A0A316UL86_9BASI|nr:UFD1-domain-containing protein [Pseudomicrostroma glucosiphilum]PWN23965.1 UFD1-domain-containing protein [Pseudomicrostroma glucosiphilum]